MKGKLFQEVVAFYVRHWQVEDVGHGGGDGMTAETYTVRDGWGTRLGDFGGREADFSTALLTKE
jgi:hypothetical protein